MEEKKALNDEKLKKIDGGRKARRYGSYIICRQCQKVLYDEVLPELVEDMLKMCRATHECPSAFFEPRDIVEAHY